MPEPTGKLKFAYQTIVNLESTIETLQREKGALEIIIAAREGTIKSQSADIAELVEILKYQKLCMKSSDGDLQTFLHMRDAAIAKHSDGCEG